VAEGTTVPINTVVAMINGEGAATVVRQATSPPAAAPAPEPPPEREPSREPPSMPEPSAQRVGGGAPTQQEETDDHVRSSPLVRRIARENNLDLSKIAGTGLGGRVTKQDVLSALEARMASPGAAPAREPEPLREAETRHADAPPPVSGYTGRVDVQPLSSMRKSIAEHMVLSRRTSAHVTTVFEADMTRVDTLRTEFKARFEREEGVKLTYMPFFIRAVIGGLKAFPVLNASLQEDKVIYKRDLNVGIAVALDWGLIVPVLHHADEKSFLGLARGVNELAERARTKKLTPADVQGGTFTVTNPGFFGSLFGTPIINQPQVAILGLGGIHKRPVVVNDAIAVRSMVYLALSFDHRLIDGATADQFMADVKRRLERWEEKIL